jgi:hypothetical protein
MNVSDLRVEVQHGHIVVTMAGTHLCAMFGKSPNPLERRLVELPIVLTDHAARLSTADFERMAWDAANAKARELGWMG